VLTIHDVHPLRLSGEMGLKGRLFYRLSLALASRAAAIMTVSEFSRREIIELMGVSADRVHLARSGVPSRRHPAEPRPPTRVPVGRFALVVGDNRPRKNLEVLARAWARFGERPPLGLVWAGRPLSRHEGLVEMADRIGAFGVTGVGWVDDGELSWLYSHAELVLFPTRYEGFGFPLVEAFSQGAPVIASDIPPLRELGEGAARFVAPDDAAGWASAVAALAGDPDERERMRVSGRARAATLSYERAAATTLAVLHTVVR
jgi:glycosyltransferase involved in cell wall biosynthesis